MQYLPHLVLTIAFSAFYFIKLFSHKGKHTDFSQVSFSVRNRTLAAFSSRAFQTPGHFYFWLSLAKPLRAEASGPQQETAAAVLSLLAAALAVSGPWPHIPALVSKVSLQGLQLFVIGKCL